MIFKVYGARDEITEVTLECLNKTRKESEDIMVFDMDDPEGRREIISDNIRYLPTVLCLDDSYNFIGVLENISWQKLQDNGDYVSRNWVHDLEIFIEDMRHDA